MTVWRKKWRENWATKFSNKHREIENRTRSRPTKTFLFPFLPIQPQRFGRWPVADRKQDRVIAVQVLMRMPLPRRHDEDIALAPVKFIGRDFSYAAAAKGVINGRAGVAVRFGLLLRPQELYRAGTGRQRVTTIYGIRVLQKNPVVGI